jgi:hypothetical protein
MHKKKYFINYLYTKNTFYRKKRVIKNKKGYKKIFLSTKTALKSIQIYFFERIINYIFIIISIIL